MMTVDQFEEIKNFIFYDCWVCFECAAIVYSKEQHVAFHNSLVVN